MATKLKVYLDTTVISAVEDARAPDRQHKTIQFFERAPEFDLMTSELTRSEIMQTPGDEHRQKLISRLLSIQICAVSADMQALADQYVEAAIIPIAYRDDAVHIAAAVLSFQDVLASWNFRHLVNRRRRSMINLLNASHGLPTIEIITPAEL